MMLSGWIEGDEHALRTLGRSSEHRPFLESLHQGLHDLRRWTGSYGGKLLRETAAGTTPGRDARHPMHAWCACAVSAILADSGQSVPPMLSAAFQRW